MNNTNHSKNDYDNKLKKAIDKQYKLILVESGKNMTMNLGKPSLGNYLIFSFPLFLFIIWLIVFYFTFSF